MPNILLPTTRATQPPGVSLLSLSCKLVLNLRTSDDIEAQFTLIYDNTIQLKTDANNVGLLYHGYDYSKKAVWASSDRGHSPEVWDRALGTSNINSFALDADHA